ncbi:YggS family pyridoxal phosphate-dependent enzyme [Buchnera aphidicola (Aphis craccivora)]|uniref:Pyridoxal phosphate homeostasis protein n=1 Tax=Buchnera aphidicola (Aphis craccivora) TaxID=466616 RepID=A0A4D6XJA1_9GAMM|nr:YggS family pyridoxal phosphate-dependent enzyme [Buchnera aphidicola]QCI16772.1 YggS family pyridoxal phosphate-dependent enzyme [Buchnera aphidicola (Aphis craccivora)]QLL40904.1 YggS family pyridoxal phosphate-dependent enzyme [Buchnera aphidicola (Aphis craccivore)]WAI17745.1 MAG: YggS family pyridoxal phosphate-dependent enzyme [Buchnera aphidicola (Aphis craccivora)]
MKNIENNIKILKKKIQYSLENNNSLLKKIKIIAASKNQSVEKIQIVLSSGIYEFGENYIQESIHKIKKLKKNNKIIWHFIGKLQSKKTKLVAQYFDWCQTIDREKIAILLNKYRTNKKIPMNVLIQINISQEENKNGIYIKNYKKLANIVSKMPNLNFRGIMAMPKKEKEIIKYCDYENIRNIFNILKNEYKSVDTLSLGTSFDVKTALMYNSNMIRIGKDIFNS